MTDWPPTVQSQDGAAGQWDCGCSQAGSIYEAGAEYILQASDSTPTCL